MKRLLPAFLALFIGIALTATFDAEARRFGGARSSGMQRSMPQQPSAPQNASGLPAKQASPAPAQTPGTPAPVPQKRSWLGPLAGLAAGVGLAALLSHFGMGAGVANFLMIALLVMAGFMLVRWLMNRSRPAPLPMQYAGDGMPSPITYQPAAVPPAGAVPQAVASLPPGFDAEGFVRQAKLNFIRLQAANDAANLDDLREFTSPEMYAEIKLQLAERGTAPSRTEVTVLNADVLEAVEEGSRQIVSVRFHGLMREDSDQAEPFNEVWHLTRPADASHGWVVAGIQQVS